MRGISWRLGRISSGVLAGCLAVAGARCSCGDTGEEINVVWSDDGAAYALEIREWIERPSILWPNREFEAHRIETEDPDTGDRETILERDGDVIPWQFYYMRRAGYFLVARWADDGSGITFEQIYNKKTVREVPAGAPMLSENCPNLQVIPSPDGLRLARARIETIGCMTHTSTMAVRVSVAILDASSLEPIGPEGTVTTTITPELTWLPDGRFVVVVSKCAADCSAIRCKIAVAVDPPNPIQVTKVPGCVVPPTTSSAYAGDGSHIVADGDGNIVVDHVDPARAFGCQLLASTTPDCETVAP